MSAFSALAGWADAITGRAGVQFGGARLSLAQMVPGRSAADLAELAGPGRARVDGPELDDQIVPGREAVQGPGAPVDGNDPAGAMRLAKLSWTILVVSRNAVPPHGVTPSTVKNG